MKTILKVTTVIAFMFATVVGTANVKKHSLIPSKDAKSFVFSMDMKASQTTVQLFDFEDNVLYNEQVLMEGVYRKKFDLANMETGTYVLKVDNAQKTITYNVEVSTNDVEVVSIVENLKPVFRKNMDTVYVNLLNLDKKPVEITVYDGLNRVVYDQQFEDSLLVEKILNFENAFADSYTVVVTNEAGTFYERIIVD
jgi:hypothetical protein